MDFVHLNKYLFALVGYRYTNGIDDNLTYAYKISVDDNQSM